ncbi:MAG: Veg family protein [Limnochordia bacterium]|nr:Veg protein [Bacillota bacterium]
MSKQRNVLAEIKKDLDSCVGKKIKLRANRGRRQVMEAEGILERTYPNVFVVYLDKQNAVRRVSYTYADVLTETVELMIGDTRIGMVETA